MRSAGGNYDKDENVFEVTRAAILPGSTDPTYAATPPASQPSMEKLEPEWVAKFVEKRNRINKAKTISSFVAGKRIQRYRKEICGSDTADDKFWEALHAHGKKNGCEAEVGEWKRLSDKYEERRNAKRVEESPGPPEKSDAAPAEELVQVEVEDDDNEDGRKPNSRSRQLSNRLSNMSKPPTPKSTTTVTPKKKNKEKRKEDLERVKQRLADLQALPKEEREQKRGDEEELKQNEADLEMEIEQTEQLEEMNQKLADLNAPEERKQRKELNEQKKELKMEMKKQKLERKLADLPTGTDAGERDNLVKQIGVAEEELETLKEMRAARAAQPSTPSHDNNDGASDHSSRHSLEVESRSVRKESAQELIIRTTRASSKDQGDQPTITVTLEWKVLTIFKSSIRLQSPTDGDSCWDITIPHTTAISNVKEAQWKIENIKPSEKQIVLMDEEKRSLMIQLKKDWVFPLYGP